MPFNLKGMGDAISNLGHEAIDPLYKLRYGVGPDEKSRLAMTGGLPGAPYKSPGDDNKIRQSDRYASGYLFGKKWGANAKPIMDVVNMIRFMDSPELRGMGMQGFEEGAGEKPVVSPLADTRNPFAKSRRTY